MAYEKTLWKDRVVEKPNTYRTVENPDGTITLYPITGQVIEKGTPISASNLNKIENGIVEINEQLDNINYHNKLFKPNFGTDYNMYKGSEKRSDETIKKHLTMLYNNGCRKLIVVVSIGMYGGDKVTLLQEKDYIINFIDIAKNIGYKIDTLKIHWKDNIMNSLVPTITNEDLKNKYLDPYTTIVRDLMTSFKEYFTDIVVLNECNVFYKEGTKYADFTNNLLSLGKANGYTVGISSAGAMETLNMNSSIQYNVSKFYLNIYPFISYKLKNTVVEDSLHSWENSYELRTIKTLKTYYPNKDIIISETGCMDYYESLGAPGVWSLSNFTATQGKASNLMLEGMFKSSLGDYVTNVYWCYWDSIYFNICGKVINYYNNGGKQYV